MVLYLCVLIVFSLHRESLKLIPATNPFPRWFYHTIDRLINLKHPIYYVISALDMTKLNHLAKTIGYSTFPSIGYTTQITVAHCN
jgi:hypothetical protein